MLATPRARTLAAVQRDASSPHRVLTPRVGRARPSTRSASSRWPWPETPATPRISPLRNPSVRSRNETAPFPDEVATPSSARSVWPGVTAGAAAGSRAGASPNIMPRSSASPASRACAADPPLAHHPPPVGAGRHFAQLVSDIDDAITLAAEIGEAQEQALRLL